MRLRERARGGDDLPAGAEFTPVEAYLVRSIGHYMDALADGRLRPFHPAQERFVAVCRGMRRARYPAETAWLKLERALPRRDRNWAVGTRAAASGGGAFASTPHGRRNEMAPLREHLQFLAGFLRRPRTVGAVAPSSERLATEVLRYSGLALAKTIVEVGAGTGAITRVLLENVRRGTRVIVVELDGQHAARLAERFPGAIVCHDSAENLRAILRRHGCAQADVVVSGLPWASLPVPVRERIKAEILAALAPDGRLCGFGYVHATWLPAVRTFHQQLRHSFAHVHVSPVIWGNLPPAFAYHLAGPC